MGLKTANLAIVFTDIVGFTDRTSKQTLEQNQRLLAVHSELLVPIFKAFGGRVVKTIGDAFLVTFESPTQAVLAGVAIQDRVWAHNQAAPEAERFEVRVAVNAGEVRLDSSDVFGEPVNIASRVEGIAEAGGVYFTEVVYLVMDKVEVPSVEVGEFELKGIPDKVRVYKVPKGPHRVEAAGTSQPGDVPPYGNLGLRRMPEDLVKRSLALTAEIGSKAAEISADLSTKAAELRSELGTKTSEVRSQLTEKANTAWQGRVKFLARVPVKARLKIAASGAGIIILLVFLKLLLGRGSS